MQPLDPAVVSLCFIQFELRRADPAGKKRDAGAEDDRIEFEDQFVDQTRPEKLTGQIAAAAEPDR